MDEMNSQTRNTQLILAGTITIVLAILYGLLPRTAGLNLFWSLLMLAGAGALYWHETRNPQDTEQIALVVTIFTIAIALQMLFVSTLTPALWLLAAAILGYRLFLRWRGNFRPKPLPTLALLLCLCALFLTWHEIPSSFGLTTTGGWTYMPGPYGQMGSMVYGPASGLGLGHYRQGTTFDGRALKGSILIFSVLIGGLMWSGRSANPRTGYLLFTLLLLFSLVHFSTRSGSLLYALGLIILAIALWRGRLSEVNDD